MIPLPLILYFFGILTVIFILGRPLYKSKPPAGNMVVLVSKCIGVSADFYISHKLNIKCNCNLECNFHTLEGEEEEPSRALVRLCGSEI